MNTEQYHREEYVYCANLIAGIGMAVSREETETGAKDKETGKIHLFYVQVTVHRDKFL